MLENYDFKAIIVLTSISRYVNLGRMIRKWGLQWPSVGDATA
jgi:hypothetical protein